MKINNLIPIIILIGFATLFFFPEPETNFLAYLGTTLFFVILIVFLIIKNKKDQNEKGGKMKKIILPGLLVGVVILAIGFAVNYIFMLFPTVAADISNTAIMRQWGDPLMNIFFVYPFLLGIILAWAWNKSKPIFKGSTMQRGSKFGLFIWLIATIPGMFITYTSMPLAFLTILGWTIGGLLNALVAGWILAGINK